MNQSNQSLLGQKKFLVTTSFAFPSVFDEMNMKFAQTSCADCCSFINSLSIRYDLGNEDGIVIVS